MVAGVHATALQEIPEANLIGVWSLRLLRVRSLSAFHPGDRGSNPRGDANYDIKGLGLAIRSLFL